MTWVTDLQDQVNASAAQNHRLRVAIQNARLNGASWESISAVTYEEADDLCRKYGSREERDACSARKESWWQRHFG